MDMTESRSVTRGTLWLLIAVCSALLIGLATIVGSGAEAWARTVEERGLENQRRITLLEARFAAMDEKLDSSAQRQKDMLDLLREHMRSK